MAVRLADYALTLLIAFLAVAGRLVYTTDGPLKLLLGYTFLLTMLALPYWTVLRTYWLVGKLADPARREEAQATRISAREYLSQALGRALFRVTLPGWLLPVMALMILEAEHWDADQVLSVCTFLLIGLGAQFSAVAAVWRRLAVLRGASKVLLMVFYSLAVALTLHIALSIFLDLYQFPVEGLPIVPIAFSLGYLTMVHERSNAISRYFQAE